MDQRITKKKKKGNPAQKSKDPVLAQTLAQKRKKEKKEKKRAHR